jgi:hypothetical protein
LEEMFLAGFVGGFLARRLTHIGYGLCFTTTRLIGMDLGANGGGALEAPRQCLFTLNSCPSLSPKESAKTIMDLDRMKDFEMKEEQVSCVELKKPGLLGSGAS